MISRAGDSRSLTGDDIAPRVEATVEKYLLRDNPGAARVEIEDFVHEIRADDLCLIVGV